MKRQVLSFVAVFALFTGVGYFIFNNKDGGTVPTESQRLAAELKNQSGNLAVQTNPPAELPTAKNPLSKPKEIPSVIKNAITNDIDIDKQIEELQALAHTKPDAPEADSLRWLIHEARRPEVLRNEAVKVLIAWNDARLLHDVVGMMNDQGHSKIWRVYCVQYLETLYTVHGNVKALAAVQEAVDSDFSPVCEQALFSLASAAEEKEWPKFEPKRYGELVALVQKSMASPTQTTSVNAIRGAARADMKSMAPAIEKVAADESAHLNVRVAAVQALGKIGRPESAPVLETCAKHADQTLGRFAALSLKSLVVTPHE